MKAGLAALITKEDQYKAIMQKSKEIYYTNLTIFSDSEDERKYKKTNDFYNFLEEDDIETINKMKEDNNMEGLE